MSAKKAPHRIEVTALINESLTGRGLPDGTADKIESDCYRTVYKSFSAISANWANPEFINAYQAEVYRVLSNIDTRAFDFKNPDAALKLLKRKKNLSNLSSQELNPDAVSAEIDEINKRKQQTISRKVVKHACPKCHNHSLTAVEYQGRSADEMSNYRFICITCGHSYTR